MEAEVFPRKIIHVDMDAFFASVEQRDHPAYKGKPLAVGGSRERGVVAAASYEARTFGVRSAMPSSTAYRLCPEIIFVKPRFEVYRSVSQQIRAIFHQYTDLVEPLSLDEAYLDVTHNKQGITSATRIAQAIRKEIWEKTQLTASAGISINKFVAKVATDIYKPNSITLIPPEKVETFLERLAIDKFHGIGNKTAEKMKALGIYTGKDLKTWSELDLAKRFGKMGRHYYRIVRALDERPVVPDRIRKSVGAENTFSEDLNSLETMLQKLEVITQRVSQRMQQIPTAGRTITLKIKYADFVTTTRSRTLEKAVQAETEIFSEVEALLSHPFPPTKPVRLLGISISGLDLGESETPEGQQLTLSF